MVAARSINVKWQHKSQDTSEVTKYILQYKEGESKLADDIQMSDGELSESGIRTLITPTTL